MGSPLPQGPSVAPEMKYCADCGKQMPRVADFCPHCGCRQGAPPGGDSSGIFSQSGRALGTAVGTVGQYIAGAHKGNRDTRTEGQKELKGIGGWLTLFWLITTIFDPIMVLKMIQKANQIQQRLAHDDIRTHVIHEVIVIGWVSIAFHITTGTLLGLRKRVALSWVKALLIAQAVSACIAPIFIEEIGIKNALFVLAVIGSWWLYFKRSVRVKNTYGRNL